MSLVLIRAAGVREVFAAELEAALAVHLPSETVRSLSAEEGLPYAVEIRPDGVTERPALAVWLHAQLDVAGASTGDADSALLDCLRGQGVPN